MKKWIDKLKDHWELKTVGQVMMVLLVFAFTGTTVMVIKKPITELLYGEGARTTWFTVAYWILILPVYNVLLLFYGFVFWEI